MFEWWYWLSKRCLSRRMLELANVRERIKERHRLELREIERAEMEVLDQIRSLETRRSRRYVEQNP